MYLVANSSDMLSCEEAQKMRDCKYKWWSVCGVLIWQIFKLKVEATKSDTMGPSII